MQNNGYINIQGWMINELRLKGNELIIYAIIYGFSQDGQSQFYGSYRYVAKALSITERSVQSVIGKLLEKGLIIRVSESHYMVEKTSIEKSSYSVEKTSRGGRKNFLLGVEETTPNIYNTNNNNKYTAKDKLSRNSSKLKQDPKEPKSITEFIEWCKKSPQKHIQVIAEWAEAEQPKHSTRGEWNSFIKRNLRPAKMLQDYPIEKIEKAYNLMLKDFKRTLPNGKTEGFITKYTLETVVKYIDLV